MIKSSFNRSIDYDNDVTVRRQGMSRTCQYVACCVIYTKINLSQLFLHFLKIILKYACRCIFIGIKYYSLIFIFFTFQVINYLMPYGYH